VPSGLHLIRLIYRAHSDFTLRDRDGRPRPTLIDEAHSKAGAYPRTRESGDDEELTAFERDLA
jgi:hypothetical protein